jgi:hypothetical protein
MLDLLFWSINIHPFSKGAVQLLQTHFLDYFLSTERFERLASLADCLADCLTWRFVCLADDGSGFFTGLFVVLPDGPFAVQLTAILRCVDAVSAVWLTYCADRCSLSGWLLILSDWPLSCWWPFSCLDVPFAAFWLVLLTRRFPFLYLSRTLGGASGTSKIPTPYVLL